MRTYGYDFNLDAEDLSLKDYTIFDYLSDYNTIYLDSGRSCIKVLCQLAAGREILVPAFSCFAVIGSFTEGTIPVFYRVRDDFTIDFEDMERKLTKQTAAIYITNYFGHLLSGGDAERIRSLKEKYGLLVIEDNTQSLFSGGLKVGDYGLASIRKWFPVPDGGVIYSKNGLAGLGVDCFVKNSRQFQKLYPQILKDMILKNILDYPVSKVASLFAEVEKQLDSYTEAGEIYLMGDFTRFLYRCGDVKAMMEKRRENERRLRALIDSPYLRLALPELPEDACPFNLPLYCTCRDEMWNYLVETYSIYPSVLWRTHLYESVRDVGDTGRMGRQIMSLPVDQRYGTEDMERMAQAVNSFRLLQGQ